MKNITKHCETMQQAERHQNGLYNKYDHVRLIRAPRFGEAGTYIWEVKTPAGFTGARPRATVD